MLSHSQDCSNTTWDIGTWRNNNKIKTFPFRSVCRSRGRISRCSFGCSRDFICVLLFLISACVHSVAVGAYFDAVHDFNYSVMSAEDVNMKFDVVEKEVTNHSHNNHGKQFFIE